jgi:DNA-binding protein YbaB
MNNIFRLILISVLISYTYAISVDDLKNVYNFLCPNNDKSNEKCKELEEKIKEKSIHIDSHNENYNNPTFTFTANNGDNNVLYNLLRDINDLDKKLTEISELKTQIKEMDKQIKELQKNIENLQNDKVSKGQLISVNIQDAHNPHRFRVTTGEPCCGWDHVWSFYGVSK